MVHCLLTQLTTRADDWELYTSISQYKSGIPSNFSLEQVDPQVYSKPPDPSTIQSLGWLPSVHAMEVPSYHAQPTRRSPHPHITSAMDGNCYGEHPLGYNLTQETWATAAILQPLTSGQNRSQILMNYPTLVLTKIGHQLRWRSVSHGLRRKSDLISLLFA